MSEQPARLVVLISGSGSNLQAILDATTARALNATVVLVVSNRRQAYGLARAQAAGVPTCYMPLKPYLDAGQPRTAYDAELARQIQPYAPDLIVLAGWMHVLSPAFLERFPGQIINLHPALPDQLPGTQSIERAYDLFRAGAISASGCMVHYVVPEVDAGPVIAQTTVPFVAGDTLDDFAARMHAAEHKLIVTAIGKALCERK